MGLCEKVGRSSIGWEVENLSLRDSRDEIKRTRFPNGWRWAYGQSQPLFLGKMAKWQNGKMIAGLICDADLRLLGFWVLENFFPREQYARP